MNVVGSDADDAAPAIAHDGAPAMIRRMAKLKSELEVTCPCCASILLVDTNLGRVISHREPPSAHRPELSEAQNQIAEEAARREADVPEVGRS